MKIHYPKRELQPGGALAFEVRNARGVVARPPEKCTAYGHALKVSLEREAESRWLLRIKAPEVLHVAKAALTVEVTLIPRQGDGQPVTRDLPVYLVPATELVTQDDDDDDRDQEPRQDPAPTGEPVPTPDLAD